jgi:hypothetical protein
MDVADEKYAAAWTSLCDWHEMYPVRRMLIIMAPAVNEILPCTFLLLGRPFQLVGWKGRANATQPSAFHCLKPRPHPPLEGGHGHVLKSM